MCTRTHTAHRTRAARQTDLLASLSLVCSPDSFASMCQKDEKGQRTDVENGLFRHALGSLDLIYAHSRTASFLSTRFPDGVVNDRSYDDRGCVHAHACTRAGWLGGMRRLPLPVMIGLCVLLPAGGRRLSARRAA